MNFLLLFKSMFKMQNNRRNNHTYLWYRQSLHGTRFAEYSKKNDKSTEANTIPAKILLK